MKTLKISFLLSLIIIMYIPFTRASWSEDLVQIIGDVEERVTVCLGFDLPTEKGLHNCGDRIIYTPSEKNKLNFHGFYSHYPCCEGYKRSNEKDVDCMQVAPEGDLQANTATLEDLKIGMIVGGSVLAIFLAAISITLCLCFSSHRKKYNLLSEA